ncbi:hypothetical protein N9L47_05875 [Rhodobacteraceae bacterium]|nr:hypothetical protein [Paracoccaceae bacterium]
MKRLKFRKLWLLSDQEKRARVEDFSALTTAIVAGNELGKSSLAKSLYATLGADPGRTSDKWKDAKVETLLEFEIDRSVYFMLRQAGRYALFDEKAVLVWTGSSVVSDLAPKVSELLDFEVTLNRRGGQNAVPPPAFCFLPFYIDQEKGWNDTWASFSGLDMVSAYKTDLARYHTGIRPKEYYRSKAEKDEAGPVTL